MLSVKDAIKRKKWPIICYFNARMRFLFGKVMFLHTIPFLDTNTLEENIKVLLDVSAGLQSDENKHLLFWINWRLWKSRNDLIFNQVSWEPSSVLRIATEDVMEWVAAKSNQTPNHQQQQSALTPHRLIQPTLGFSKVNFDGSFNY